MVIIMIVVIIMDNNNSNLEDTSPNTPVQVTIRENCTPGIVDIVK